MKPWLNRRDELLCQRWLAPLACHLRDDRLWHMERISVARAVAVGLFFGLLLPVAQVLLAVACAVWLRCHVGVAAAATLVTNPFTLAPVYWLAHHVGSVLLGHIDGGAAPDAGLLWDQAQAALAAQGLLSATLQMLQGMGAPLALGLGVLAVGGALLGYALVWLLWRSKPREDARLGA